MAKIFFMITLLTIFGGALTDNSTVAPTVNHPPVNYPPLFTQLPSQYPTKNLLYLSSFTLQCLADASPPPVYDWLYVPSIKPTSVVPNRNLTALIISPSESGNISIEKLTGNIAGTYRCVAKNMYGTAVSHAVYVEASYSSPDKGAAETVSNLVKHRSGLLKGRGIFHNPLGIDFTWKEYNGDTITDVVKKALEVEPGPVIKLSNKIIVDRTTGSLHLTNVQTDFSLQPGHSYYLTTRIKTNTSSIFDYGAITKVTTTTTGYDPTVKHAPKLMAVTASPVNLLEGDSSILVCITDGVPIPTVTWTTTSERNITENDLSQFNSHLTLANTTVNDTGIYTCTSTNSKDKLTKEIKVNIHPLLIATKVPPAEKVGVCGSTVEFECYLDGYNSSWFINNQPFNQSKHARINTTNRSFKLNEAERWAKGGYIGDNMVVQCVIQNGFQSLLFNTAINIVDRSVCPSCTNGGYCVRKLNVYNCNCTKGFSGRACEICDTCPPWKIIIGASVGGVALIIIVTISVLGAKGKLYCQRHRSNTVSGNNDDINKQSAKDDNLPNDKASPAIDGIGD